MFNKVILVGNLTRDPELRYTTGKGTAVTTLGLAVNNKFKPDDTLFIDVVVWGKSAEAAANNLTKGRQVLVEGELQERKWESGGETKKKTEVNASTVKFLGKKGE